MKAVRCKWQGSRNPPVKIGLGLTAFLAALIVVILLSTNTFRAYPNRIGNARKFLQQLQGRQDPEGFKYIQDKVAYNVVYVTNAAVAERLHCPVNHTLACFYSFLADLPELSVPSPGGLVTEEDCSAVFKPLPVDRGRPWCVRQGREPAWLQNEMTTEHRYHVTGSVLLTGELDGPNPTHQANLHFLAIWRWMKKHNVSPGMLHLLVDSSDTAWSPGKYGTGLANALGKVQWLPLMTPGLYRFQRVQFSIPDGVLFPFDLKHHTIDANINLDYLELAETIKIRMGCLPRGLSDINALHIKEEMAVAAASCSPRESRKPTIVLAKRTEPESRIWHNVEELASELRSDSELVVKVVSFGKLDFQEQVHAVAAADVLVGVTGSDLVNLMFLPPTGSIVEIFPSLNTEGIFVPELGNMAKLLGKNHFTYMAEGNITVNEGEPRLIFRTKSINVAVKDLAALVRHALQQSFNGSVLTSTECNYDSTRVRCIPKL